MIISVGKAKEASKHLFQDQPFGYAPDFGHRLPRGSDHDGPLEAHPRRPRRPLLYDLAGPGHQRLDSAVGNTAKAAASL